MELYKEILAHALVMEDVHVTFSVPDLDVNRIVEMACYKALETIREILEDDSLEDDTCFMKIEEIVRTFERMGCSGGGRHDFG